MTNKIEFKSIGKILIKILVTLFFLFIVCLVVSTGAHQVLKAIEQSKYQAPGELVSVDGHKMHVFSKGSGSKTIVLLSGYGTGSPVIDFSPLTKELSKSYKVIVVENFGYGWSDITKTPRTAENIVNETRTALKEAGFNPPYILMPHSIWGIYSLYYANMYPQEIESIIGIDTSVPSQIKVLNSNRKMSRLATLEEFTGLVRIEMKLNPSRVISRSADYAYTDDEIKLMRLMYCWHANNAALINEANQFYTNFETVQSMQYPKSIPILFFISKTSADGFKSLGMNWVSMHEQLISDNENSKCLVLSGPHYLHRSCSKIMGDEVRQFLEDLK